MRKAFYNLVLCLLLLFTTSICFASLDQFAGYWTNVDPNSRGIVALDISVAGTSPNVQAWGNCDPTPCDWGTVTAYPYDSDVSSNANNAQAIMAAFDAGFSETTLVMSLSGSQLKVESYDLFKDNSGRSNYATSSYFQKSQAPGGTNQGEIQPPGGSNQGGNQAALDLTGIWNCDDGGKYYIRQLGNMIWWFGEKDPDNPDWSNVMRGTLSGNTITADWADVPKGSIMQSGSLKLSIVSSNEINAIQKTGGFVGSSWTRPS
jgi:hypothetical protein